MCNKTGEPNKSRKEFLKHVSEDFNNEVQTDFMFANVLSTKYCVSHMFDTGTRFCETETASQRYCETVE